MSALLLPEDRKARRLTWLFFLFFPLLYGALALWLGQDANWDLRNYHWYNAYAFLKERYGFDLFPSQTPFFYNPLLDVPFFLLAQHTSARLAAFLLGTAQGLNVILLFMLAHATLHKENARQKIGACAGLATLGVLGSGGIAQIGTVFYDNVTSLGVFLSALLVLRFWTSLQEKSLTRVLFIALLCGLPTGVMMGLKLPCALFAVGLCGGFFFVSAPWHRRLILAFGFGLGVLLGFAITYGFWGAFLYEQYGNPFFPYFNNFFHAPLAPPADARDAKFIPDGWQAKLFFPFSFALHPRLVGEIDWRGFHVPVVYFLFFTVLPVIFFESLLRKWKSRGPEMKLGFLWFWAPEKTVPAKAGTGMIEAGSPVRYLLGSAALSYATWLFGFSIYRYLLPLEMLAPLLIVLLIALLPLQSKQRVFLTFLFLALIAASVQPGDWIRKKPWLEKTVEVTVPPLDLSTHPMILMASHEPYAHVIPAFPPSIPFVRIESNFKGNEALQTLIQNRLNAHQGSFKLLIPDFDLEWGQKTLRRFGLKAKPRSCQPVKDHLYDSRLLLCDAQQERPQP